MTTTVWTIPDLLLLSGGYWSTCALHAGVKLDIFSALDGTASTAVEVAQLCNADPRATGMLLDALVSLGLLEKRGDVYTATQFAETNLSKTSPGYLGHIIMHHHHLMAGWSRLHEAVATGDPISDRVSHVDNESVRESFLMGMFNLASLLAPKITKSVNLSGCRNLLDLGGGPGTYAIHFCLANPDLTSVVYDLPTTRTFAEKTIARYDLARRVAFIPGDFHVDPLPDGFDAVWLSHVLHADGPEACAALLRKAAASLNPGGVLMVQEFILDDAKCGPQFPALFSLNMLLGTDAGQSYSGSELSELMAGAGLSDVRRLELELPNGAGVMTGRKV
ncbi:MAG: methyltransferase [Geobacteraceae bacterium]|nr:methyltransferase [Geobacteraceae bacterium]NTW78669.1 methyltransferase [Geobacteraceae bacterium]